MDDLWNYTLELTDLIVPVSDHTGKVKLAFVDGDFFALVSKDVIFVDDEPDRDSYNVAPAWMSSLFKADPEALYDQCAVGLVRDPTTDCCRELSWSRCSNLEKNEVLKLMHKAATDSLCSDKLSKESRVEAQRFLNAFERAQNRKN